ncbi:MAG: S16 family serine protease [Acidimicrobiales bacterium]
MHASPRSEVIVVVADGESLSENDGIGKLPRRAVRWLVASAGIILVLALLVVAASLVDMPYYSLSPGQAVPVSKLVSLPTGQVSPLRGKVLMTDVEVAGVNLLNYVADMFASHTALIRADELTGPGPANELNAEAEVEMIESKLTARAEALRQMGYSVPEHNAGAVVWMVLKPSPAWGKIAPGDVVTAVNGEAVTTASALAGRIASISPGTTVDLTVTTVSSLVASNGTEQSHPTYRRVRVKIGGMTVSGKKIGFLGIAPYTQGLYAMPFGIGISTGSIGGPSAGLAFTLGILDELNGGDLTGGKVVAVTGTIRPNGAVGRVGGVREKTIAVERGGASVFIVPRAEYKGAISVASKTLKVVPVTSLEQALSALVKLGGKLGRASTGAISGSGGHSVPQGFQYAPWS